LQFTDFSFKSLRSILQLGKIVFGLLKFAIQFVQYSIELGDAALRIEKHIRVDNSHLAHRQSDIGSRSLWCGDCRG
jgi:hypothetical protein